MYTVEQQARETQTMSPEDAERVSTKFKDRLTMNESTLRLRKNFLPRNLNGLGTIFGGDLLEWMEGAAHLCASNFTRNSHVITIAMDKVLFKVPISVHHLLELTARVVYCRNHTLQVRTHSYSANFSCIVHMYIYTHTHSVWVCGCGCIHEITVSCVWLCVCVCLLSLCSALV